MTERQPPTWPAHQVDEDEGDPYVWLEEAVALEDGDVRVPPGAYTFRVVTAARPTLFGRRCLHLVLEIIEGPHRGVRLDFYANFPKRPSKRSKFMRAWVVAHGRLPQRGDRLALKVFQHRLFLGEVRDVTHDRNHLKLAHPYSLVSSLLERLA